LGRDAGDKGMTNLFYDEQEEHSRVKADIVASYFAVWATVMSSIADQIGYLDLYAGRGRYRSGEPSTPLLVLQQALDSSRLRGRLVAAFNDSDTESIKLLKGEVARLDGTDNLRHPPSYRVGRVSDDYIPLITEFQKRPTLTFLDPWGYQGLSRALIRETFQGFGCEVVFFFNYARIRAAIENNVVEPHMQAIFTAQRLDLLRREMVALPTRERELCVMIALAESIEELGRVLPPIPFRFARQGGQSSRYIVFVTKHLKGYEIMKEVMASRGVKDQDGVPKFAFLPASKGHQLSFTEDRPLLQLGRALLDEFGGRRLTVEELIADHTVGRPFIPSNYKTVLLQLESAGAVQCERPARARKNMMGNKTLLTFPRR
jgi:three-Cys-motif partner protein